MRKEDAIAHSDTAYAPPPRKARRCNEKPRELVIPMAPPHYERLASAALHAGLTATAYAEAVLQAHILHEIHLSTLIAIAHGRSGIPDMIDHEGARCGDCGDQE